MKFRVLVLGLSLFACSRSSGTGPVAPEACVDLNCQGFTGSSDQTPLLQLERNHTNARDILVSWTEVSGVSDFKLELAEDENCQSVKKSYAVSGQELHLIDLEEGVWHLCLKSANGVAFGNKSEYLVVDRTPPLLEGETEQTLLSGASPALTMKDTSETKCSWSSSHAALKIMEPDTLLSPFSMDAPGTYSATVFCEDLATNSSSLVLTLTMALGEASLGPAPSDVTGLQATPGVNTIQLSWSAVAGVQNYLVLESSAPVTAVPMAGMFYTVGSPLAGATVKATGNATAFSDNALAGNSKHYYKVFAVSSTGRYAAGVEVNATAIAHKVLKANFTRNGLLSYPEVVGLRTVGNYSYVCRGESGLAIVNVTNPSAPVQTSLVSMGNSAASGWCSDVKISGNHAYVADWDKGLVIIDITNPAAPVQRGSVALTNASVVFVEGSYAYVAVENNGSGGGLAVINISNPAAPTQTSFTSSNGHGAGISKVGNYVYLTHRDSGTFRGLKVYDVSNPAAPALARTLNRTTMEEIDIRDNFAYITVGSSGLEIFDVTTPSNPVSRSTIATSGNGLVLGVNVVDNYAFITDYTFNKMYAVDVSNKAAPSIARSYTTTAGCLYMHVNQGFAYMSVEGLGLEVIEVFQFL